VRAASELLIGACNAQQIVITGLLSVTGSLMTTSDDRLARTYIAGLELAAVYVTAANRRTRIRQGDDPAATLKSLRKTDPGARLVMIGWCAANRVEMLMMALRDEIDVGAGESLSASDADEARARVTAAAEQLGLVLWSDAELQASAEKAVQHVARIFQEKLRAGELRDLNQRYRHERLARTAAGKASPSYALWLNNQKVALIRATAQAAGC
jgi:hypothetical protein